VLPGTYNLTDELVIRNGVALRGLNVQTCTIQMLNVTADTTLVTMGESTRVEDLTFRLTSSQHHTLRAVAFGGTTAATSKIRTCVISVDNSAAISNGASNVYGVECYGSGSLGARSFSYNCLKGSTINVLSNGGGNKRGILISNTNIATTRDLNVYVAAPPANAAFTGSYVGIETNDPANTGSIQLRTTTVGTTPATGLQTYTSSDILQTTPAPIVNPTYLASAGIQVGPGTDLVSKSAGGRGFSAYLYPTTLFYGLKGLLNAGLDGYLWPGTQAVTNGLFPDNSTPPAFYRIQQPTILRGVNISMNTGPSGSRTTVFTIYRTPVGGAALAIPGFLLTFTGNTVNQSFYNASQNFAAGDLIHVGVTFTGGSANLTTDVAAQLDLY
jgi:hypothetical protein